MIRKIRGSKSSYTQGVDTLRNAHMNVRFCFYFLGICLGCQIVFGHEVPVHVQITQNAAAAARTDSPAYNGFVSLISPDCDYQTALEAMKEGSRREDDAGKDEGGNRSYNHFYDPLDTTHGKGLSDIPEDTRGMVGTNSFAWASISNCMGLNFHSILFGIGSNIGTSNIWSWQNARAWEWIGLTESNTFRRHDALTNMFRAVGQVMHLLEDTSQPQHVRNEQHVYPYTNWLWRHLDTWISPIETYGDKHYLELNYQADMLDWRGVGFLKLNDFWDRHKYNGDVSALYAAENGGAQLGLAEWCNGNFLGARHLFPEYFKPGSIEYYPYPSRDHSTDYSQVRANPAIGVDSYIDEDGKTNQGIYLRKTGNGVAYNHIARINYLGAKIPGLTGPGYCTIDDPNVEKDYHDKVIPKAVEYSAGLLDYFFRGTMTVSVGVDTNANQYTVTNVNTSGFNFGGGNYYIYEEGTNGVRTLIQSTNMTTVLMTNASMTMTFYGPIVSNAQFLLVYQGTIGVDGSGKLYDPVDAGIGIAIATFNLNQLIFDLSWSDPTAELDFYLVDPCGVTLYEPDLYTNLISPCCTVVGGDDESSSATQHMVVSNIRDGQYQLWVNYEGGSGPQNATLTTTSVPNGQLSTESFTLSTAATGQNGGGWPTGVTGPATVDTSGMPSTDNASWYVRKVITIQNGKPVDY